MIAGIVVVSFDCYAYTGFPKFSSEAFASAVIGFNLNPKATVESIINLWKVIRYYLVAGLEGSGFNHPFVDVLNKTVVSICYQVGNLAAS